MRAAAAGRIAPLRRWSLSRCPRWAAAWSRGVSSVASVAARGEGLRPRYGVGGFRPEPERQRAQEVQAAAPADAHPAPWISSSPAPGSSPAAPRSPHSAPTFVEGQLTRDFISASLYSASTGYFNSRSRIFSTPSASALDFAAIQSRDDYYRRLAALYEQLDDCWLTPVELFKPHYARAIARWILHTRASSTAPLRIVEVGGGNGTCALGILDYLRDQHPDVYYLTHYSIVDLSIANQERQRAALAPHLLPASASSPRVSQLHMSMLDWQEPIDSQAFIICLEVLDNLPHDKVVAINGQLYQTHVHSLRAQPSSQLTSNTAMIDPTQKYKEAYRPIADPFIREYLAYHADYASLHQPSARHSYGSFSNHLAVLMQSASAGLHRLINSFASSSLPLFIPSTALHLFHVLHHFLPNHRILIADFSSLPDAITGINAPVVSGKEPLPSSSRSARIKDYGSYLIELGAADIFFPTDFEQLQFVYNRVRALRRVRDQPAEEGEESGQGSILTNYEFMQRYASLTPHSPTRTGHGWDPLLLDYVNVKFFVT